MGNGAHMPLRRALFPALAGAALLAPTPANAAASTEEVAAIAKILGGAHYVRIACYGEGDQSWRDQMVRLLSLEAPDDGGRRRRLVEAFNDGYQEQERRARQTGGARGRRFDACTPDMRASEARLAAEGKRLAQALAQRYLD